MEFHGGKREIGESQKEALISKIKEELDLDINISNFLTTINYDSLNFHLTMHCFICQVSGRQLNLNVHNDAKWITFDELDNQK